MRIVVTLKGDREKLRKLLRTKKGKKASLFMLPAAALVGPYDKPRHGRRVSLIDQRGLLSCFAK